MNTNFEQIAFIKDSERRTRNVNKEHFATLREQVTRENTFDVMDDIQALGTMISMVKGGAFDPMETAQYLINTFGSLKGVIEARPEQLEMVAGMTPGRVQMISMVIPMVRLWHRCAMETPDRIGNSREAENYCLSLLAGRRNEAFYVIALNSKCNILGKRQISEGSLSEVNAYPRMVMETALNYNAHSILLSHNHPGGTCAPSPEDIASTIQLQRLLNGVGILVLDHIIVANEKTYSMIQHGDIDYRIKGH